MRKIVFYFLLFIFIENIHSSDLRLYSLAGISSNGINIIYDYIYNSFFVNPAILSDNTNDKLILNHVLDFHIYPRYDESNTDISNYNQKQLTYEINNTICFMINVKNIFLGFKLSPRISNRYSENYSKSYYSSSSKNYYIYNYSSLRNNISLSGNFLLSFKIKNYGFGFDLGINSNIYSNSEENQNREDYFTSGYNDLTTDKTKGYTIYDIKGLYKYGFSYHGPKIKFDLSFPIEILAKEYFDSAKYNKYSDSWKYKDREIGFKIGTILNLNKSINEKISLNIPVHLNFDYTYFTRDYSRDITIFKDLSGDETFFVNKISFPIKSAVSIIVNPKNNISFHFGLDSKMYFSFINGNIYKNMNYPISGLFISLNIGGFIGAEFIINKIVILRIGFKSLFFEYIYNKKENIDKIYEDYKDEPANYLYNFYNDNLYNVEGYNFYILKNLTTNCGVEIIINKYLSLEFASGFLLGSGLDYSNYSMENIDEKNSSSRNVINTYIWSDLGIIIKI